MCCVIPEFRALISILILTLIVGLNWVSALKLEQKASKKLFYFLTISHLLRLMFTKEPQVSGHSP